MFMSIVFVCLMLLLFLAGGAAIHMGFFKAHRETASFTRRVLGGVAAYGMSAGIWFFMYSHHYLGW
jgi:hypothetical protein